MKSGGADVHIHNNSRESPSQSQSQAIGANNTINNNNNNNTTIMNTNNEESDDNDNDGFMGWNHDRRMEIKSKSNKKQKSRSRSNRQRSRGNDNGSGSGGNVNSNSNSNSYNDDFGGHNDGGNQREKRRGNSNRSQDNDNDNDLSNSDSDSDSESRSNHDKNHKHNGEDDLSSCSYSSYISESDNSDSIGSDESTDTDQEWSISIRLNSVVDLPSSIIPNVPLCPILKFGLLSIQDPDQRQEIEYISAAVRRAEYEQTKDEKSKVLPQTSIRVSRGILHDFQSHLSLVHCAKTLENEKHLIMDKKEQQKQQHGHEHEKDKNAREQESEHHQLQMKTNANDSANDNDNANGNMQPPSAIVKQSSGKIISKKDNGMMEWHEEMRWDGISNPLHMVLAIELSTRAVPVPVPVHVHVPVPVSVSEVSQSLSSSGWSEGPGLGPGPGDKYDSFKNTKPIHQLEPVLESIATTATATASAAATGGSNNANANATVIDYENRYEQVMMRYAQDRAAGSGSYTYPSAPNSTNTNTTAGNDTSTIVSDAESIANSNASDGKNANGILGLWRRGKQNLAERRKRTNPSSSVTTSFSTSTSVTTSANANINHKSNAKAGEVANQAAVLAKHLVHDANYRDINKIGSTTTTSASASDATDAKRVGIGIGTDGGTITNSTSSPAVSADEYGDLRLGTLLIPLSNLPLEETIPRVEKWYQFDTLGNGTRSGNGDNAVAGVGAANANANATANAKGATSPRGTGGTSSGGSGMGGDGNNLAPWRDPTVLLDISMCTSTTLNQLEDEAYAALGGDESINAAAATGAAADSGPSRGTSTKGMIVNEMNESARLQGSADGPNNASTHSQGKRPAIVSGPSNSSFKGKQRLNSHDGGSASLEENSAKLKQEELERLKHNGPYLEPGIIDYICVVGAKNIGDQKDDDGKKGWVNSDPECCVLEQFPSNEFHKSNGRSCVLPEGIEWWCFPEGCRLWRGSEPPSHMDMNLKRFSASSPPRMASSIAAFDACLNCTTSFMWFVLSSNSNEYGASIVKTYGAVIRFYAEVPGESGDAANGNQSQPNSVSKRGNGKAPNKMWCPLGICLTSSLPIIGILEAVLLRLCEKLASAGGLSNTESSNPVIHKDIMNLILNFHKPIPGVVNCSIPFLSGDGDRLHVSLPPKGGIPPLPHGVSVASVCRLLGAEGLTALLAAIMTECKILVHSADVANLAMVAEVITALMYPFQWLHPFIPVLPLPVMTIVEAPVSYFLGVPTCNMKLIDKHMLTDVVVIDLDNGFSSPNYFDSGRNVDAGVPTPLPATVSSNISKAIFRLLREEEEVQEQYGSSHFSDSRHLPRLETESLAERDFRVTVAHQICGLIRGYQECLFFVSANTPVFNRDRFLRQAPALFEERRPTISSMSAPPSSTSLSAVPSSPATKIISPRSKRFLSGLVNSQHFHALLEKLDSEENAFFHEVMDTFEQSDSDSVSCSYGSLKQRNAVEQLRNNLEKIEQKIPTYHVHNRHIDDLAEETDIPYEFMGGYFTSFTCKMLKPVKSTVIAAAPDALNDISSASYSTDADKPKSLSLEDLVELDKRQWIYSKLFDINVKSHEHSGSSVLWKKIHLKEALGERKFSAWKDEQESKDKYDGETEDERRQGNSSSLKRPLKSSLDLTKLISNVRSDEMANRNFVSKLKRGSLADRTVIKRYIERAYEIVQEVKEGKSSLDDVASQFSDINSEVDAAMKNSSAQRFLISVLSQRSRLQNENRKIDNSASFRPGYNIEVSTSNLHPLVFDCLYRLCSSMLEACHNEYDYEAAYRLLIHTTGFCTVDSNTVSYMTKQIANHPIYNDLRLWDRVLLIHMNDRQRDKVGNDTRAVSVDTTESDEYEATVSTLYEMLGYGMPADDLARFASRITEEKFYSTDKEQKLLMLARRLAVKCDESTTEDDLIRYDDDNVPDREEHSNTTEILGGSTYWKDVKWTHPGILPLSGQTPITNLASFGNSIVATGGLDGSIYLASTMHLDTEKRGKIGNQFVRGTKLDWPLNPQLAMGTHDDLAPGAVSCLAATRGSQKGKSSELNISTISGCRLVGGSTGGNLAVWNVANTMEGILGGESPTDVDGVSQSVPEVKVHSSGTQTGHVRSNSSPTSRSKRRSRTKKGKSLGGHRGGVTCLSIPPKIYRPDSLISAGNDGLIKFWSLRDDAVGSRGNLNRRATMGGSTSRILFSRNEKNLGKDTLDVLAGHGGRILCVETAWHGDRLLSGAADRTVKLWDLASQSGGRCLQTMHGHTAWVTHGRYWGRNTIISASSDRSIALWDTRSGSSPLKVLRYHNGPISDLYLESRTSFWMTSAGADGTVATWDFRMMKSLNGDSGETMTRSTNPVRTPLARMTHIGQSAGPVFLQKGISVRNAHEGRSIMSATVDNKIKEWDPLSGNLLTEHKVRCGNKMSCFKTFSAEECLISNKHYAGDRLGGTITAAWDGTIRIRQLFAGQR